MSPAQSHSACTADSGLLIAVAGVGPGSGVTTSTVALARTWPGPEPAIVVEADPGGGHLAEATGADPYRGLASMARAAHAGAEATAFELSEHLQSLPGGVAFLACPPGPDAGPRAAWTATMLTGSEREQRTGNLPRCNDSGVTVFADCGAPETGSVTASILTDADAGLIVVRADRDDPAHARRRILELTDHGHRRGILLIDSDPGSDYAGTLGLPILAHLPDEPHSATALLLRAHPWFRRNRLLPAAGAIAAAIQTQLRPPLPAPDTDTRHARPTARSRARIPGRTESGPTVYRIDPALRPPQGADPVAGAEPSPVPRRISHQGPAHPDTGHTQGGHRNAHAIEDPRPTAPQPPTAPPDTPTPPGTAARDTAPTGRPGPDSAVSDTTRTGRETTPVATDTATGAPEPVAAVSGQPVPVLAVEVFGPLKVLWRPPSRDGAVEITRALRPRERELLIMLAVHPAGAARDTVIHGLWPEHHLSRPGNTLNTVVSRLRTGLGTAVGDEDTEFIENDTFRYRLGPGLWDVDYVAFDTAVTALRTAVGTRDRERACRAILGAADGVLGEELRADWIAPIREHARRDRLKALGKLAAMLVEADPDQTLALLETALALDPTNEPIYQDILRLHARLGERTVINPTLALLKRRLESIGDIPTQKTLDIARLLRDQHNGQHEPGPGR